jgi:hypothetical protein
VLFPATRPTDDGSIQLRSHQEVGKALTIRRDPGRPECLAELRTRQETPARHGAAKDVYSSRYFIAIDLELPMPAGQSAADLRAS